jgi:hypothetical protein
MRHGAGIGVTPSFVFRRAFVPTVPEVVRA